MQTAPTYTSKNPIEASPSRNALLADLISTMSTFGNYLKADEAAAKAKSIADSYASLRGANKDEEQAARMVMKHFGIENPQILNTIFMYVNKFEGSIAIDYTKQLSTETLGMLSESNKSKAILENRMGANVAVKLEQYSPTLKAGEYSFGDRQVYTNPIKTAKVGDKYINGNRIRAWSRRLIASSVLAAFALGITPTSANSSYTLPKLEGADKASIKLERTIPQSGTELEDFLAQNTSLSKYYKLVEQEFPKDAKGKLYHRQQVETATPEKSKQEISNKPVEATLDAQVSAPLAGTQFTVPSGLISLENYAQPLTGAYNPPKTENQHGTAPAETKLEHLVDLPLPTSTKPAINNNVRPIGTETAHPQAPASSSQGGLDNVAGTYTSGPAQDSTVIEDSSSNGNRDLGHLVGSAQADTARDFAYASGITAKATAEPGKKVGFFKKLGGFLERVFGTPYRVVEEINYGSRFPIRKLNDGKWYDTRYVQPQPIPRNVDSYIFDKYHREIGDTIIKKDKKGEEAVSKMDYIGKVKRGFESDISMAIFRMNPDEAEGLVNRARKLNLGIDSKYYLEVIEGLRVAELDVTKEAKARKKPGEKETPQVTVQPIQPRVEERVESP